MKVVVSDSAPLIGLSMIGRFDLLRSSGMQARKRHFLGQLGRIFQKQKADRKSSFRSIIDLGTEYVKTLVVEVEGEQVTVIGHGQARHGGDRLGKRAMAAICDRALCMAEDMTEKVYGRKVVPDRAVMGVPASLVRGAAYTVRHRRGAAQRQIGQQELKAVLQRVQRLAFQQLRQGFAPTGDDLAIVHSAIVEISVDGHRVTNPIGFRGQVLTLTVFNALARRRDLAALQAIANELELEPPLLALESQALAHCLKAQEALIIDVGGRITAISLVGNGSLVALRTLPISGHIVTRRLAEKLGLSSQQAEDLKIAYNHGKLNEAVATSIQEILAPLVETWLSQVKKELAGVSAEDALPPYLYLCGGGSELSEVVESVHAFPWMRALPFVRYPEIQLLNPFDIPHVLNRTGIALTRGSTVAMGLARWASRRKSEEGLPTQLLNKVTKEMEAFVEG